MSLKVKNGEKSNAYIPVQNRVLKTRMSSIFQEKTEKFIYPLTHDLNLTKRDYLALMATQTNRIRTLARLRFLSTQRYLIKARYKTPVVPRGT